MKYLVLVLLAAYCAAQTAPATITGTSKQSPWVTPEKYPPYHITITNVSDKVIVGVVLRVDEVNAVGDKVREQGFEVGQPRRLNLKPGKKHEAWFSNYLKNTYVNPRATAVRFADGTVWRATEEK